MATATIQKSKPTVTLVLSADEAEYVYSALQKTAPSDESPLDSSEDPIYSALGLIDELEWSGRFARKID